MRKRKTLRAWTFAFLLAVLAACGAPAPSPTPDMDALAQQALLTAQAAFTQTAQAVPPTAAPSATPLPSPTAVRTPPALPPRYVSAALNPKDTPHAYIQDTCEYLKAKWDPNNAAPGTVVLIVMFHSIINGEAKDANQISAEDARHLLEDLHEQGFVAIDTQQLADFLYHNAKIPPRSVLLVVDDRHHAQYFNNNFRPFWEKYGWKVVNGFISHPDTLESLWEENAELEAEGWVDHQAHGVIHNIPMSDESSDEYIRGELQGSIEAIQEHFGKTPIAIVWPGGGFGARPVQMARELGYQLGFTVNPRGPVMFNWIPLADEADPMRPSYMPEGWIKDPLLLLPRYWDTDARAHIDEARRIGKEAAAYAEQNKETELLYYDIVCAPTYGAIPTAETP